MRNGCVLSAPAAAIAFFHGYTCSAYPAACATGIAALDVYERAELFERAAKLSPCFLEPIFALQDLKQVTDIRSHGLLAGVRSGASGVAGYPQLCRVPTAMR